MKAIAIVGVVLVAAGAGLGAQDSLSAAKDLYASAAYEDALSTLSRLDARQRRMSPGRSTNIGRSASMPWAARVRPNRSRSRSSGRNRWRAWTPPTRRRASK